MEWWKRRRKASANQKSQKHHLLFTGSDAFFHVVDCLLTGPKAADMVVVYLTPLVKWWADISTDKDMVVVYLTPLVQWWADIGAYKDVLVVYLTPLVQRWADIGSVYDTVSTNRNIGNVTDTTGTVMNRLLGSVTPLVQL